MEDGNQISSLGYLLYIDSASLLIFAFILFAVVIGAMYLLGRDW